MAKSEVDKHISNVDSLMAEIGDLTSGRVKDIVDNYENISIEWNNFLDDRIAEVGGTFSGTTEQEKIDFLREKTFYTGKDDFLSKLQGQVVSDKSKKAELKKQAEEVLKNQHELIEQNNSTIKELNDALKADIQRREALRKEIAEKENEIKAINEKIRERSVLIADLESEISKLDPDKDKGAINAKRKQIDAYKKEGKVLSDKQNDIQKDIDNKTAEKKKIIIGKRQDKINELADKNKDLQKHLDENYQDLNQRFSKDGITLEKPGTTVEKNTPETPTSPAEEREDKEGTNEKTKTSNAPAASGATQPAGQKNALVKLSDKQIAMNMAKEFRESKTLEEQRKMINGYGYTDLAAMMPYLGLIERKKMFNAVREARNELIVPDQTEFSTKIEQMTGDPSLGDKWYDLLFAEGEPRDFKRLEVEELRDIQRAFETVNEQRNEIGKRDPELLEYFDKNFAQFVKTGSLLERVKTGRIKGFFADMVNGKQKAVRDKLSGSMRDYTMARQDEKTNKQIYENSIRSLLGQEVKPVTDPSVSDRSDTRHESQLQNLDKRNTSMPQR